MKEAAEHLGMTDRSLSSWERGVKRPGKSCLNRRLKTGELVGTFLFGSFEEYLGVFVSMEPETDQERAAYRALLFKTEKACESLGITYGEEFAIQTVMNRLLMEELLEKWKGSQEKTAGGAG